MQSTAADEACRDSEWQQSALMWLSKRSCPGSHMLWQPDDMPHAALSMPAVITVPTHCMESKATHLSHAAADHVLLS